MLIRERLNHKRPIFSFEFFPPKTQQGQESLWRSLESLSALSPDFVSVTYGAGGSTRARTLEVVTRIKRELGIEPVAHLTCVGATRDELRRKVGELGDRGIFNILAIRGDPPRGKAGFVATEGGLKYAAELVALIRDEGDFCVGAACYPEVHTEAADAASDLRHLKEKVDAGADYLITQLFFDNELYRSFVQSATAIGIDVPIIAGVMPVTNYQQIDRFSRMCGASIPAILRDRMRMIEDDPQEVFWAGVMYAAHQCRALLEPGMPEPFARPEAGAPGIHFYTLNRSPATRAIFEILRLARSASL